MDSFSIIVGRLLLGLYFLLPGIAKLVAPESQLVLMEARGIVFADPFLLFAGISSVLGALALISGRYVKLAAYGLVVYTALVNVLIHPVWIIASEGQNFIKNVAIIGGLLILAGYAPLRWLSLSKWWKSDAALTRS